MVKTGEEGGKILINRMQEIKNKGFNMTADIDREYIPVDFSKIKVGIKSLEDATYNVGIYKKVNPRYADKENILKAINNLNYNEIRDISNFYFKTSGIYKRLCEYFATIIKFDWMLTPYINKNKNKNNDTKVLEQYDKALKFLDNFQIKKFCNEVTMKVIKNGCYYGYLVPFQDFTSVQELPVKYCRSRFNGPDGRPVVEFNMKFFDEYFTDPEQKSKMLKLFPQEFKKGYIAYREGKLRGDFAGDDAGWYLLDPKLAIKFNLNGEDIPAFINTIPAILDLDEAKDLDRKKMEQELLKIIIQKMPIDKNGDLVFDVDEARELHNNAVRMLGKAVGIDVLTTFADTAVEDMSSSAATTAADDSMERVRQAIFDDAGITQMLFNSQGNMAVDKSAQKDAATLQNLVFQFEAFLNSLLDQFNRNPKKFYFKLQILDINIFNYKDMAQAYKEQVQLGYSRLLPQIAMGISQSTILANVYFENEILKAQELFNPEQNNQNTKNNQTNQPNNNNNKNQNNNKITGEKTGRPPLPDDQKSEKTMRNLESQS